MELSGGQGNLVQARTAQAHQLKRQRVLDSSDSDVADSESEVHLSPNHGAPVAELSHLQASGQAVYVHRGAGEGDAESGIQEAVHRGDEEIPAWSSGGESEGPTTDSGSKSDQTGSEPDGVESGYTHSDCTSDGSEESDDDDAVPEYSELCTPLHDGCSESTLQTIWDIFTDSNKLRLPVKAVRSQFTRLRKVLPTSHRLPSYAKARGVLEKISGVQPVVYEMCKKGCVLYRDEAGVGGGAYRGLRACPECGLSRQNGTQLYTHLSLVQQLTTLAQHDDWCHEVFDPSPANDQSESDDVMRSILDSPAYAKFHREHPGWKGVLGALCTDGVNPFKGSQYSIWPFMWKILNYSPVLASRTDKIILIGVIHGPRSPPSLQPVLRLIVEELVALWNGVQVATNVGMFAHEVLKACMFLVVGDYPALSKLRLQQEAGSMCGCMFCHLRGESKAGLQRVTYSMGERLLPREEAVGYVPRDPPRRRVHTGPGGLVAHALEARDNKTVVHGVSGVSELLRAPHGMDFMTHSPVDATHASTVLAAGHVIKTVKGSRLPTKLKPPKQSDADRYAHTHNHNHTHTHTHNTTVCVVCVFVNVCM
jgi:hypothetical protein